jgi:hypothetical protein
MSGRNDWDSTGRLRPSTAPRSAPLTAVGIQVRRMTASEPHAKAPGGGWQSSIPIALNRAP